VRLRTSTFRQALLNRFLASLLLLAVTVFLSVAPCFAQSATADSELTTTESEPNFKLQVERNVVQVRVVVRNAKGEPVDNLKKEDFLLFDRDKQQTISHFSVERPAATQVQTSPGSGNASDLDAVQQEELKAASPKRFLALFFDDIRMPFEDVALARKAAQAYLTTSITAGDRVGIFTSSGLDNLDFTSDRDALDKALIALRPRPADRREENACPEILDYQAYLMVSTSDAYATEVATRETLVCRYQNNENFLSLAAGEAQAAAMQRLNNYQMTSEASLRRLDEVIRRLSAVPGQRGIVLVSTGFLALGMEGRVDEIVNRALKENVIVSTLDSRGLDATLPGGDASEQHVIIPNRPDLNGKKLQYVLDGEALNKEVLKSLAYDTGGLFVHGSNDLQKEFLLASGLPGVYYNLAFSPSQMKFDGRFHNLTVKLVGNKSLTVEARLGYFAPSKSIKPEESAREDIAHAIFSQEELSQIPMDVHTQFFKQGQFDATLSILARFDLRFLQFRKEEGRNLNVLTVVTVIFDRDGNFIQGKEKKVDLRLRDASLEKLAQSGLTMRTSFDIKPGTYLVREVVRDSEGAQLSGLSKTVDIPF
jgi:VWFA-related protein